VTVINGQSFTGQYAELPIPAPAMIGRVGPVEQVQSKRLPQPADPQDPDGRADRRRGQPRPPARARRSRSPSPASVSSADIDALAGNRAAHGEFAVQHSLKGH
jgi:hypothetical protein